MGNDAGGSNEVSGTVTGAVVQANSIQQVSVAEAAPSGKVGRPAQLPPDVVFFTGRTEELAKLDALLVNGMSAVTGGEELGAVVISAIAGAGGMGKTSLAVHWAHQVRDQFLDGQLYVNLRGYDPNPPLDPALALSSFLRALGMSEASIPQDLDGMIAAYRSLLADRRILVVLDNAATAKQVRPLLPNSAKCLVVVTSRSRLSGLIARDGARRIVLDQMSAPESISLLRDIIGANRTDAEPDAVRALARNCAYLPLALRIAAERVADRDHLSIAELAGDLVVEHDRLDLLTVDDDEMATIRAVFSWSYRALPVQVARIFRLLSLAPGSSISIPAAAALACATFKDTRRYLDTLTGVHLLTEFSRGRFQFHDLIRDYAAEEVASDPERHDATRRVLVWYCSTARATVPMLHPEPFFVDLPIDIPESSAFASREEALEWFDTEYSNVLAAVKCAADHGHHDIAACFPDFMSTYQVLRSCWSDRVATEELGLISARQLSSPVLDLHRQASLAEALFWLGQFDKSSSILLGALMQARQIGSMRHEAAAQHMFGVLSIERGDLDEAVRCFKLALPLYREIKYHRGEALMLGFLGEVGRRQQRLDYAVDLLHQSLTILRKTSNRWNEAICLRWLAHAHMDMHNKLDGIEYLQQSIAAYREVGDRLEVAITLRDLGDGLSISGQEDRAQRVWQEALALLDELDAPEAAGVRVRLGLPAIETGSGPFAGARPVSPLLGHVGGLSAVRPSQVRTSTDPPL